MDGSDHSPLPQQQTEHLQYPLGEPTQRPSDHLSHTRRQPAGAHTHDRDVPSLSDESTIRPQPPPPTLKPFYSVISDITNSLSSPDTHYPRVRYIFNDDDPDMLSEALVPQKRRYASGGPTLDTPQLNERLVVPDLAILLDLIPTPDGREYTIESATSLSSGWAVSKARLRQLESTSPAEDAKDENYQTMILDIEGLGIAVVKRSLTSPQMARKTTSAVGDGGVPSLPDERLSSGEQDYAELVRVFDSRMALLKHAAKNLEDRRSHVANGSPP